MVIIDKTMYKDSAPKMMHRAEKATTPVILETLKEFAHSMPRRLENAIKDKGG